MFLIRGKPSAPVFWIGVWQIVRCLKDYTIYANAAVSFITVTAAENDKEECLYDDYN